MLMRQVITHSDEIDEEDEVNCFYLTRFRPAREGFGPRYDGKPFFQDDDFNNGDYNVDWCLRRFNRERKHNSKRVMIFGKDLK